MFGLTQQLIDDVTMRKYGLDFDELQESMKNLHRIELLKVFYRSMDLSLVKWETCMRGWDYIKELEQNCTIDYIQGVDDVTKYRLSDIPSKYMHWLLDLHVRSGGNVCGYFDMYNNNCFAFNLDVDKDEDRWQADKARDIIVYTLIEIANLKPIIIKSGRGYHIWVSLLELVPNKAIHDLFDLVMIRIPSDELTALQIHKYPFFKESKRNSLRLFGSKHVRTDEFSGVMQPYSNKVLSVDQSWMYINNYVKNRVNAKGFYTAIANMQQYFDELMGKYGDQLQ
jgi:hypothetical protein